jgi:hypothetical protein
MRLILVLSVMALLPSLAAAKRAAPPKVEPVIHEGIRYVAPNDDSRRAYVETWDVRTNKKLWDLTVFTNTFNAKLEEDVQWVFIKALSVEDSVLLVTSEHGRRYQVDLKMKVITQSNPVSSQAPTATAPPGDIPESVKRAIANGAFAKNYAVSFHLNPFYLRGDFSGDGKIDVAVSVKQRSTGKVGIAIINGVTDKVRVLGAGTAIGNGGDNFDWMDSWETYSKDRVASKTAVPKLHGDALLLSKSEAASALIYWNGKRYVWLQQGD